jgi:alpha-galactosidase
VAVSAALLTAQEIYTPAEKPQPRINGARVVGVRPGNPFFFHIPVSGVRPLDYRLTGLPAGLSLNAQTGNISGTVAARGSYPVTLTVTNASGSDTRQLLIKVGDTIALTPPMGWNPWNCYFGDFYNEDTVKNVARVFAEKGLIDYGWTYINIDDKWSASGGTRQAPAYAAVVDASRFPDMKGMVDYIHGLGLKAGTYHTPWMRTYQGHMGGSSDAPPFPGAQATPGTVTANNHGRYSCDSLDVAQFAAWGFDFLKLDWRDGNQNTDVFHAQLWSDRLKACGRDIALSLSNTMARANAADWGRLSTMWRTGGDIAYGPDWGMNQWDSWTSDADQWAAFQGPGRYNDWDMMLIGIPASRTTAPLTWNQEYYHMSLWCLRGAPLLLGCDASKLDTFTLNLLRNAEVIEIDQDPLCVQGTHMSGSTDVVAKPMSDGSVAVGFFNVNASGPLSVSVNMNRIGLSGRCRIRDVWRQQDVDTVDASFSRSVPALSVFLFRAFPLNTTNAKPARATRAASNAVAAATHEWFDLRGARRSGNAAGVSRQSHQVLVSRHGMCLANGK